MSRNSETLIEELGKVLGNKPYFTGNQLIAIGLFGSATGVATALKKGTLPSIKISKKRTVVPRSAVLEYFRNNLVETSV